MWILTLILYSLDILPDTLFQDLIPVPVRYSSPEIMCKWINGQEISFISHFIYLSHRVWSWFVEGS